MRKKGQDGKEKKDKKALVEELVQIINEMKHFTPEHRLNMFKIRLKKAIGRNPDFRAISYYKREVDRYRRQLGLADKKRSV